MPTLEEMGLTASTRSKTGGSRPKGVDLVELTAVVELDEERGEAPMEGRSFGSHHHRSTDGDDNSVLCVVGGFVGFIFGIFGFLCSLCIEEGDARKKYLTGAAVGCVMSAGVSVLLWLTL
jgi:hypothetical protein